MAKGRKVVEVNLVNYNSKVTPEAKQLLDALVTLGTNGVASQRELLDEFIQLYGEKYPVALAKAREIVKLKASS